MLKRSNVTVTFSYRHPDNNIDDFNTNYVESFLQKISKELSKNFSLLGDFNIDVLEFNGCISICNFLDEL